MFSDIITTPHEADASRDNLVSIITDKKPYSIMHFNLPLFQYNPQGSHG